MNTIARDRGLFSCWLTVRWSVYQNQQLSSSPAERYSHRSSSLCFRSLLFPCLSFFYCVCVREFIVSKEWTEKKQIKDCHCEQGWLNWKAEIPVTNSKSCSTGAVVCQFLHTLRLREQVKKFFQACLTEFYHYLLSSLSNTSCFFIKLFSLNLCNRYWSNSVWIFSFMKLNFRPESSLQRNRMWAPELQKEGILRLKHQLSKVFRPTWRISRESF